MLVGSVYTDSNGVESLIPQDSTGFYLARDAEIMVDVLDKKLSYVTKTTIGGEGFEDQREQALKENKDES